MEYPEVKNGLQGVGGQTPSQKEKEEELSRIESAVREVLKYYYSDELYEETKVAVHYFSDRDHVLVVVEPNVTKDVPTQEEDEFLRDVREYLDRKLGWLGFKIAGWLERETVTHIILERKVKPSKEEIEKASEYLSKIIDAVEKLLKEKWSRKEVDEMYRKFKRVWDELMDRKVLFHFMTTTEFKKETVLEGLIRNGGHLITALYDLIDVYQHYEEQGLKIEVDGEDLTDAAMKARDQVIDLIARKIKGM